MIYLVWANLVFVALNLITIVIAPNAYSWLNATAAFAGAVSATLIARMTR